MLTRSLPFLPIISPRLMYLDRLLFTLPRTILRKRWWSRSIFCPTAASPQCPPAHGRGGLLLDVAAGEDARHEAQHVGRAHVAIPVVADQAALHHVDLFLGRLAH